MPFNIFKAFRSRKGRDDPAASFDYSGGHSLEQGRQGGLLLRKSTKVGFSSVHRRFWLISTASEEGAREESANI